MSLGVAVLCTRVVALARAHAVIAAPYPAEIAQQGYVFLGAVLLAAEGTLDGLAWEFGRIDCFVEDS